MIAATLLCFFEFVYAYDIPLDIFSLSTIFPRMARMILLMTVKKSDVFFFVLNP